MDEINFRAILAESKSLGLRDRVFTVKIIAYDYVQKWLPFIAISLWVTLLYLLHTNDLYRIEAKDIPTFVGSFVAVAGLAIAESQLTSWKQEKLLDRLEEVLLSIVALRSLCNALEQNGPRDEEGKCKLADFLDTDMNFGARLVSSGLLNVEEIAIHVQKVKHQIIFIKKLLNIKTFRFNSAHEIKKFLDQTSNFLANLMWLIQMFENLSHNNQGTLIYHYKPGQHSKALEDHYALWIQFNHNRHGELSINIEEIVPPTFLMHVKVLALIQALRV